MLTLDGSNTNANTLGGIVANGTATTLGITKSGVGTWNLPAANTFTGPIIVNNGLLALGAMTIGTAQTLTLTSGTLSLGSGDGVVSLNTTATGTGTLALEGNAALKTLTSLGAGYDGNIEIIASPAYTAPGDGATQQVAVKADSVNAYGSSVGTTTVTNTGTGIVGITKNPFGGSTLAENFIFNANSSVIRFEGNTGTGNGTMSGNFTINSGILRLDHGGNWVTYSGIISGPGKIDLINPSEILTGTNTFSGGLSVGMGTGWYGIYGISNGITVGGSDTLSGGAILNGPLGTGTLTFDVASAGWNGTPALRDNGQVTTTLHNSVVQRNSGTTNFRSQSTHHRGQYHDLH